MSAPLQIESSDGFCWKWDPLADAAALTASGEPVWSGPLLPLFWLRLPDGENRAVKAAVASMESASRRGSLALHFGGLGTGALEWSMHDHSFRFDRLEVAWAEGAAPAIIALHWGAEPLRTDQRPRMPLPEAPFWPAWQADGFCIPSAKGGPIQSFFRCWDFGHATLPLGSFGPALGTPYAAAFPRPLLAAAMGGPAGWMCLGAGGLPDGALCLQIRSTTAALEILYREDVWGPQPAPKRTWLAPLWLHWDALAWNAYRRYFQAFPAPPASAPAHQASQWNTWGDFKDGHFELPASIDRAADQFGVKIFCVDDFWESSLGSGQVHAARFPEFDAQLAAARERGLAIGFWQAAGWVDDPQAAGLSDADLLVGADGQPVQVNWCMSPHRPGSHFCLDPASPRAREFLRQRTRRLLERYRPALLKLDFAYGLPSPHAAVSRDPSCRGERMGWDLLHIIAEAAREVHPDIALQYYSIHPLFASVSNLLALDDLGDTGGQESAGHGQWSVWASLVGERGMAICGSSGYRWDADDDVLLNTAVLGAPGSVLPRACGAGRPVPAEWIARRQALARWHRRTLRWRPAWLTSEPGALGSEPQLRSWGRWETFDDHEHLTALALRPPVQSAGTPALDRFDWTGAWALIAQDNAGISSSRRLAVIPFSSGSLSFPFHQKPARVTRIAPQKEAPLGGWTWRDGLLTLRYQQAADGPVLGFLVESEGTSS